MARATCAVCAGLGRLPDGTTCTYCNGTGTVWVPDKLKDSDRSYRSSGRSPVSNTASFEDYAVGLISVGIWILAGYYGTTYTNLEWYWPVGIGLAAAILVAKLFMGPLRFILTGIKYLLGLLLLGFILYMLFNMIKDVA